MADFLRVEFPDGTEALFQTQQSDLVSFRGEPTTETAQAAAAQLGQVAEAAAHVASLLRSHLRPDELALEVGVGLSGEVGWFFAKSTAEASLKVTLTWKKQTPTTRGADA